MKRGELTRRVFCFEYYRAINGNFFRLLYRFNCEVNIDLGPVEMMLAQKLAVMNR